MGGCVDRPALATLKCDICSKGIGDKGRKHLILCPNGHYICSLCQLKSQNQHVCPQCQIQIVSIKAVEINKQFDQFKKRLPRELSALRTSKEAIANQTQLVGSHLKASLVSSKVKREQYVGVQLVLDQGLSRVGDINNLITKQKRYSDKKQILNSSNMSEGAHQYHKQQAKILRNRRLVKREQELVSQERGEKKICGCSLPGFLLFIVLFMQVLMTLANAFLLYFAPHSECMDKFHIHPLLVFRPLLFYVSGIQIVLLVVIVLSAIIYKLTCISQSLFDKWIIFLKLLLGLKQLLWATLMVFMQITMMPEYCSIPIARFSLISAIANGTSLLMLLFRPLNTCLCTG